MVTAAPPRGHKKRARTRQQLLDAAARVIARQGAGATAIHEIAAEAGVANGTFYNYFPTKDAALEALGLALAEQLADRIAAAYAGVRDAAERMAIANRTFILTALADPTWGRAIVRVAGRDSALSARIAAYARADLRLGKRQRRFRVADEPAALDLILGTVLAAMRSVLDGRAGASHATAVATLVLRGLGVAEKEAAQIALRPLPGAKTK
jgi:AcrR family transcriptional regulator